MAGLSFADSFVILNRKLSPINQTAFFVCLFVSWFGTVAASIAQLFTTLHSGYSNGIIKWARAHLADIFLFLFLHGFREEKPRLNPINYLQLLLAKSELFRLLFRLCVSILCFCLLYTQVNERHCCFYYCCHIISLWWYKPSLVYVALRIIFGASTFSDIFCCHLTVCGCITINSTFFIRIRSIVAVILLQFTRATKEKKNTWAECPN